MDLEGQVISWLAQQDIDVYLVGGCVRDRLLGRPTYDLDLAVDGDGLRLARRLANHFQGDYYPLDVARSTGRALLRGAGERRLVVDVARFRGADGSAELTEALTADLANRDFTINALAMNARSLGEVIDQHGGLADLEAGVIRPISESCIRDDPLRALRALRQAAELGFSLASQSEALIRRDGLALRQIAGERVRDELARLLALPNAAPFLRQMDDLGLLTVIFPDLEPLRGLEQPPPHYLDALAHSLETVRILEALLDEKQAISDLQDLAPFAERLQAHLIAVLGGERPRLVTLKLAALLHDTGKPATRSVEEGRMRFIGHHKEGAKTTGAVLRRLRFNRAEVRLGEMVVRHHMRPLLLANQEEVSPRAVYRFFRDTGDAGVDVLLYALADHRATCAPHIEDLRWPRLVALVARMLADYYERSEERVAPPPLVDGYDLLRGFGLQSGPQIGEVLEAVREAQASGEVRTCEEALSFIRQWLDKKQ